MATARTIITDAAKLIGVWQKGESLDSDEAADGLRRLNGMIESWNNEYLMVYQRVQRTHSLVSGTAQYTIGSGGTINTTRPLRIESAYVRDSADVDRPLSIINNEQWSQISLKSTVDTYPTYLYYRPNYALGEINLHQAPGSSMTLYLECTDQLSSFSTLATSASLPPSYEHALTFNLAVLLAPSYGTEASPTVMNEARHSKAVIKETNDTQIPVLESPFYRRTTDFRTLSNIFG